MEKYRLREKCFGQVAGWPFVDFVFSWDDDIHFCGRHIRMAIHPNNDWLYSWRHPAQNAADFSPQPS